MRFIYLTLPNLHTNTCDLHSRAGTKMLARSTRLPPHPNTKRESGDETREISVQHKIFLLTIRPTTSTLVSRSQPLAKKSTRPSFFSEGVATRDYSTLQRGLICLQVFSYGYTPNRPQPIINLLIQTVHM